MRASATAFAVPTPFSDVRAGLGSSRIGAASQPRSAAAAAGLAIVAGRAAVWAWAAATRLSVHAIHRVRSCGRRDMSVPSVCLSCQAHAEACALLGELFGPTGVDQLQRDDHVLQSIAA